MDKSLVNILIEARDSLTQETWRKGDFFQLENNTLCMCAHGAVQRIITPKVKQYLEKLDIRHAQMLASYMMQSPPAPEHCKSILQVWGERPDCVKISIDGYGTQEATYLLFMVGLTLNFNDHPNTTLEMIKEKFNQAIEFANSLNL